MEKGITLLKGGLQGLKTYSLIVTEKPDAANRIASALDEAGEAKKIIDNGVPYYVAKNRREIVVVPALGHLYTVASHVKGRSCYPVFDICWVPRYLAERGAGQIRNWLETISKLAKGADTFIDACDYDIEGSIIGYCILKYACGNKEDISKRMKYSTLTEDELRKSYAELLPHLDFALIEAGLTRHEVDWLYGVNVSRALTIAARKCSSQYATLSTGRVQGPALKFLAMRENDVRCFVPNPYWVVKARIKVDDSVFEIEHEKQLIEAKEEAEAILNACKGKTGVIERIETKKFQQLPPVPFDLSSLQSEAYSFFGYTPMRTSNIAQHLYLDALISYPRTSSQKLPPSVGYEVILRNLGKIVEYRNVVTKLLSKAELKPNEGKKEDTAHPAIYPTGNLPGNALDAAERKIWNLVVRRFMAAFGEPALRQSTKVTVNIEGNSFNKSAIQTLEEGWLLLYKPFVCTEDFSLPPMKEGQKVLVEKMILEDKFTKPPPRYNPSSLLGKMEKEEVGTKATRARIIQTLYDRKYIRGEKIVVTDLGLEVIDVLKKYCPSIVSLELTRKLEQRMNEIQQGYETREKVLKDTIDILKSVTEKLRENEKIIGEQLNRAIRESKLEEKVIGACPTCQSGRLVILHSKKTRKRFVGCTNYFEGICKTAFPLPQKGIVKPLKRACKECGWPTVSVRIRRNHLWNLCLNPKCPTKKREKILKP
jgi:DNA topoisomerase-1